MRMAPRVGLNLSAEHGFRVAAMPLFEAGLVDALEWDVDESWLGGDADRPVPDWAEAILDAYAEDDALYGHGVWFSLLSARPEARQERWLARLAEECARRRYRHVSEHFGWMTSGPFEQNTMLPCPRTPAAVAIGVQRLGAIARAAGRPVGLENTASVLCAADALEQGELLEQILAPVDGFLLLDVHNVWTTAVNLGLDALALLRTFPLARVRELHVSGGTWLTTSLDGERGPVRLDSHDAPMPAEALPLLRAALADCPNVEVVFYERRGDTLYEPARHPAWRDDFLAVRALVAEVCA
jgi:uncharacterized protein (UPF0276 family)